MLKTLPYYGGKARAGVNRWIRSLLPTDRRLYVEPFAGMLSILINRPPAAVEIASDSSRHIMRWWEAVRMHPEDLARRIRDTPVHRGVHEQARQMLFGAGGPPAELLDHAWAVAVVVCDSLCKSCSPGSTSWAPSYATSGRLGRDTLASRISTVADRIRRVQLETRDACAILERTARHSDALIYCDPPYQGSDIAPYGGNRVDHDRLIELLRAQRGDVAISGYGDTYECLGWERHEHRTLFRAIARGHGQRRTEVLWRNFRSPPAPAEATCG